MKRPCRPSAISEYWKEISSLTSSPSDVRDSTMGLTDTGDGSVGVAELDGLDTSRELYKGVHRANPVPPPFIRCRADLRNSYRFAPRRVVQSVFIVLQRAKAHEDQHYDDHRDHHTASTAFLL